MHLGKLVFEQVTQHLPLTNFIASPTEADR